MRLLGALLACAVLGLAHVAAAAAQDAPVQLAATDEDGLPLSTAVAGEHWLVAGSVASAVAGDQVTLTVARNGTPVRSRTLPIAPDGRFGMAVRERRPGVVTVSGDHGGVPFGPLTVPVRAEGRARRGCGGPATVRQATALARARLGSGARARRGELLEPGAVAQLPAGGRLRLDRGHATYAVLAGRIGIGCHDLRLVHGTVVVTGTARLAAGGAEVARLARGTRLRATGAATARLVFATGAGRVASARWPRSWLAAQSGDVVLTTRDGLPRLSTWPFARSPDDRPAHGLPPYWADGRSCSAGCRPAGAVSGWPLRPFHVQHPLRAGLNELRPANLHIGIDIQALDGTPVYAIQSGRATIAGAGTVDERVQVGSYQYWHVIPHVFAGEVVRAYRTVIGTVLKGAGHVHLSELRGGAYLNPLRPGRVLAPYSDHERPVIGAVRRQGGGIVDQVFDPQSLRTTLRYRTPVLAPAAVAWRARDARGHVLTPLRFAYRGSQHLPNGARGLYAPDSHAPDNPDPAPPGWSCFWSWTICIPRWDYRLGAAPPGTAAVTVYAWDWAGNTSERTSPLT